MQEIHKCIWKELCLYVEMAVRILFESMVHIFQIQNSSCLTWHGSNLLVHVSAGMYVCAFFLIFIEL